MKVGIITYHRALNYGAVLQCYALQQVLKKMGHEVNVIDFRQPVIESLYALDFRVKDVIKAIIGGHPKSLLSIYRHWKTVIRFHNFIHTNLNCTKPCMGDGIPQNFEAYVIGSDQMWSFNCVGGYEPVYFGQFQRKSGTKLYGYAISSCGDFMDIMSKSAICKVLDNFNQYSLREQNIAQRLALIVDKNIPLCLDPTLLLDADDWSLLVRRKFQKEKYVFLYQVRGGNGKSEKVALMARKFAEDKQLKLIDMSKRADSVEDFVSAIKFAKYVFTTSFHATVFSVIFGVPFASFKLNDGHDDRYMDLLESLNLNHHLFDINDTINTDMISQDDKENVLQKLNILRKESIDFLKMI